MTTILRRPSLWIVLALALAALGVLALRARGPEVRTVTPTVRDLEQHVVASGRVRVPTRIQIAAQTSGLVVAVAAVEGQRVAAGDLLVQLAAAEARTAVAQAKAAVDQAMARVEQLRKVGAIVASESLAQASSDLARAEADLARAEALGATGAIPAVIVFLSALIGGLQVSLIDKTLGSQPHVTLRVPREAPRPLVEPTERGARGRRIQAASQRLRSIDQWASVIAAAERTPGVTAVSPSIAGAGFAVRSDAKSAITLRGVDPERFLPIIDVRRRLVAGRFEVGGGVVTIGPELAAELGVGVGDTLRLSTPEGGDDVVSVAGVFQLGNLAVDRTWVLTSLRHAQSLYALPGGVTTIELKVGDVFAAERVATDLRERTGLVAESWMTINADLLTGLSAQSSSKNLIQFFVVLAVALGIASVLIVSVVQKEREIGILRAVGTPARRILLVFLIQGGVLGVLGSVVGSALGALLAKLFEGVAVDPSGAPRFPVQLDLPLFALASGVATLVGVLAAAIPARRASRLDPATAIRHG